MEGDKKVNEIVDAITEIIIQYIEKNRDIKTKDEKNSLQMA